MEEEENRRLVQSALARIPRLKYRSVRDRLGLHTIEGIRAVLQALDASIPIDTIVYSEILCRNSRAQKQVRMAKRDGLRVARVTPMQFRWLSTTERASGLAAIVKTHWTPLSRADPRVGLCWIAVSRIRSAGNLGTIVRTAEATGAAGLILLGNDIDPFDPAVLRASMGGIFHLKLVRASLEAFKSWARGARIVGTSPAATTSYTEIPVDGPLVILLGEERHGLAPEELALCTDMARIPIVGRADSLNVGVAAGVVLYDVLRRTTEARRREETTETRRRQETTEARRREENAEAQGREETTEARRREEDTSPEEPETACSPSSS